ncbi:MAG: hypothetical protein LBL39_07745 [Planctomycetaceae bacterium]|nr:hypothetical protein [Planctomycetaceae bacterium]
MHNRRWSEAQPPDMLPLSQSPAGARCVTCWRKKCNIRIFTFNNLAPAGLERLCGAAIRRLRYRYTAGYAHHTPAGLIKFKHYETCNT